MFAFQNFAFVIWSNPIFLFFESKDVPGSWFQNKIATLISSGCSLVDFFLLKITKNSKKIPSTIFHRLQGSTVICSVCVQYVFIINFSHTFGIKLWPWTKLVCISIWLTKNAYLVVNSLPNASSKCFPDFSSAPIGQESHYQRGRQWQMKPLIGCSGK